MSRQSAQQLPMFYLVRYNAYGDSEYIVNVPPRFSSVLMPRNTILSNVSLASSFKEFENMHHIQQTEYKISGAIVHNPYTRQKQ